MAVGCDARHNGAMPAPRRPHRVSDAFGAFGATLRHVAGAAGAGARVVREHRASAVAPLRARLGVGSELGRGIALVGTVWSGGRAAMIPGVVVVDGSGTVVYLGPLADGQLPEDLRRLGGPGCWIGPGIVDAHVHLGFGSVGDCLKQGLVGVRDLGASTEQARLWRTGHRAPPPGRRRSVSRAARSRDRRRRSSGTSSRTRQSISVAPTSGNTSHPNARASTLGPPAAPQPTT